MKKLTLSLLTAFIAVVMMYAEVNPGDNAIEFSLTNVDGTTVSLSDYSNEKGVILVFTCNPCPFAKAYEQRIIQLHENYASQGFPVVAINPNDDKLSPEDTFENMKTRANDKSYPFPYLKDETQDIYQAYGATRTPHIFLLNNEGGQFKVAYVGAIDDNAMDASQVSQRYLENAIRALLTGEQPEPALTKAIGCSIKSKA